jgi:uncharacterized LabA/DUF88 family protein
MLHYAILIDAGFAKRKLGAPNAPATPQHIGALIERIGQHPLLEGMRLHRVYYYDALPLRESHQIPLGGGARDFASEPTAARSDAMLAALARMPFVALRLGELSFEGWEVPEKILRKAPDQGLHLTAKMLKPRIKQKGVDMRIGMDIAALTLKQQVQALVLVSADSDFVPAMQFARREGAQLLLCPLGQSVKPSMREHSDVVLELPQTP